jgi:hypothetical protein
MCTPSLSLGIDLPTVSTLPAIAREAGEDGLQMKVQRVVIPKSTGDDVERSLHERLRLGRSGFDVELRNAAQAVSAVWMVYTQYRLADGQCPSKHCLGLASLVLTSVYGPESVQAIAEHDMVPTELPLDQVEGPAMSCFRLREPPLIRQEPTESVQAVGQVRVLGSKGQLA